MSNLPLDFNYLTYLKINEDIGKLNEPQAIRHYLAIGKAENRLYKFVLPKDYNYKDYLVLNSDLNHLTESEAKEHYLEHGIFENRLYKLDLPKDFNSRIYLKLNEDLSNMTDIEAKIHYSKYGLYEKRPYVKKTSEENKVSEEVPGVKLPDDFDWYYYISENLDIRESGINTEEKAKLHYITYGYKEPHRSFIDPVKKLLKSENMYDDMQLFDILINTNAKDETDSSLNVKFNYTDL